MLASLFKVLQGKGRDHCLHTVTNRETDGDLKSDTGKTSRWKAIAGLIAVLVIFYAARSRPSLSEACQTEAEEVCCLQETANRLETAQRLVDCLDAPSREAR